MIVKNLGVAFGDKTILKDISFEIGAPSRIVALVGKSGIGKTQMIRRLAGLYIQGATSTGDVLINDKSVKPGDVGVVFQDYYLPNHLKVRQMLHYAAKNNPEYGPPGCKVDQLRSWYIDQFELAPHLDKYCSNPPLSGGQRQRVAIVTQLLSGTDFLLMDEPTSGLDYLMKDKTIALLKKVVELEKSKTILIVTHDLRSACAMADQILIVSQQGRDPKDGASIIKCINMLCSLSVDSTINEIKQLL